LPAFSETLHPAAVVDSNGYSVYLLRVPGQIFHANWDWTMSAHRGAPVRQVGQGSRQIAMKGPGGTAYLDLNPATNFGPTISWYLGGVTYELFWPVGTAPAWNPADVGPFIRMAQSLVRVPTSSPPTTTTAVVPTPRPTALALPKINSCAQTSGSTAICNTPYWAGYIREGATAQPIDYELVTGSWSQPSVDCNRTPQGLAVFWVGIGGVLAPLVQIGTDARCTNGAATYSGWWETVYGTSGVNILRSLKHTVNKPISAGDKIAASVAYAGHDKYDLVVTDSTAKWTFGTGLVSGPTAPATRGSADCIVERPAPAVPPQLPLADFGKVDFSSCTASGVLRGGQKASGGPGIVKFVITQDNVVLAHALPASVSPATLKFSVVWDSSGT
jgi:hypothetical protein